MSDEELMRQLLATFVDEAREHVEALTHGLLVLKRGARSQERGAILADAFREAHSLKGAARAVGQSRVETLAHDLETVFSQIEQGAVEAGPAIFDGVHGMLDEIRSIVDDLATPETAPAGTTGADAGPASPAAARGGEQTVRVATSKLDALMSGVGELFVGRSGLERRVAEARELARALETRRRRWRTARSARRRPPPQEAGEVLAATEEFLQQVGARATRLATLLDAEVRRLEQITANLQDDVLRSRMLPVHELVSPVPKLVRDLCRGQGKQAEVVVVGGDTQVDRSVIEALRDPLTHLVRNCVDHGVETPAVRAAAGKEEVATIRLTAAHVGDNIRLDVEDDGAGIDPDLVRRIALERGLLAEDAARTMRDEDALQIVFRPGLSTSPRVTGLSGRGVGLDVVRNAVERLGGSVEVRTEPGRGTRFSITAPLSIATTHCLLVRVADQTLAIPTSSVERIIRVELPAVERAAGRDAVRLGDEAAPLVRLHGIVGTAAQDRDRAWLPAVLVGPPGRRAALVVDDLAGTQEVVSKPLPDPLSRTRHAAGATILGSGEVVVILNVAEILRTLELGAASLAPTLQPQEPPPSPVVLVVEDSITTRTLEKSILEAAGYRVRVAADGLEAWRALQEGVCDLVVADVQMPVMDGFELTRRIRASERLRDLPVILVTALASDEDRNRGLSSGADAYIVKRSFDQTELLETVRRLI